MQVDRKGQPVEQRRRDVLVVRESLVECHHAEAGGVTGREAIAFERDFLRVEHRCHPRRRARRQPLGHRQQHDAAVGKRQHALLRDRPTGLQRGCQIEPSEQSFVVDVQRYTPHRGALG
jgi:hypothetical protein